MDGYICVATKKQKVSEMRNRTKVLLGATLTFLFSSQTAMAIDAYEGAERDEYSIGITWETASNSMDTSNNKVNYSLSQETEDSTALEKELFPEYEGR